MTVFLAAGIFFFDRFLSETKVSLLLFILLSFFFLLIPLAVFKYRRHVLSYWFGVIASICFFFMGGLLLLNEKNNRNYTWNDKECLYYGIFDTTPEVKGKTLSAVVRVIGSMNGRDSTFTAVNRDILLYWINDSTVGDIDVGDKVLFKSRISVPVSDVDFMGFDYRRFLLVKGISGTSFSFPSNMIFEKSESVSVRSLALNCRNKIVGLFEKWNLDEDNRAVISALAIGDKSELTAELKDMYSAAGTSHVLALSGLHIGILSAILYILLWPVKKIRYGDFIQSFIVVLMLWAFAFVSGLSPSVVRAVTMCSLYFFASLFVENGLSGLYSLVLTAFLMLVYQPFYLFDISFQLSFIAVFSIILFFPFFNSLLKVDNRIAKYVWGMISVSMSAQLGTMPLVLYYFGSFPTYFIFANIIVSPLAVCILFFSLASLSLAWLPYIGNFCVCALNLFTGLLNDSMRYICGLYGSQIKSIHVNEFQMLIMFVLIICVYSYIRNRKPCLIILSLLCLNLIFGIGYYRMIDKESPSLFLAWSGLYLKNGDDRVLLTSNNGIYSVYSYNIGVMNNDYWRNKRLKKGEEQLELDYTYFCRGFKGDLKSLTQIFCIKMVILDSSLSDYYRIMIKKQCLELNIPFSEISNQASYKIVL